MMRPASAATDTPPPVILIGAGGHARVLIDTLRRTNREILFATDSDPAVVGRNVLGVQVEGPDECVLDRQPQTVELVNAVGSVASLTRRQRVFERFTGRGYGFARVVHPSAVLSDSAELAEGVQVMAGAVIQPGARIGPNSLVNTGASVDHDVVIAAHVHVASGATLSGGVTVGQATHIGAGAVVIQQVTIGQSTVVGAGAVVIHDVADGMTVVGVPARPIGERRS